MKNSNITISPYVRIVAAGCDIEVRNHSPKFVVALKRGEEKVAVGEVPRGGSTAGAALQKARLNAWGPTSAFYKLMDRFADIAESMVARK